MYFFNIFNNTVVRPNLSPYPFRTVPYRTVLFFVFLCIENFLKSFTVPYCFPLLLLKPRIVPLEKVNIFRFLLKARSIPFEENNRFPFLYKKRDSYRTKVKIVFRYTKESANRTVLKKNRIFITKIANRTEPLLESVFRFFNSRSANRTV